MPCECSPRAAIIIPAYKQPGLLPEAILSALGQNEPSYVVVVIDGCPMQETREVASTFAAAAILNGRTGRDFFLFAESFF